MTEHQNDSTNNGATADSGTVPDQGASHEGGAVSADGAGEPVAVQEVDRAAVELAEAKAETSRFRDQWMRTAADFDNYRKRARRDVEEAQRKGLEQALLEVLPVSDNLERAVQAAAHATDVQSIVEGVHMVLKSFEDAFSRLGVERVPSVGHTFDPGLHEAVQQVETAEAAPGTIISELAPGYRLRAKLLRAAMVSVARPPQAAPPDDQGSQA